MDTDLIKILRPISVPEIMREYAQLVSSINWADYGKKGKQAGVQYKSGDDPWTSSVGRSKGDELSYTEINPVFKSTVFEEIINEFGLKRTRLMWLEPMSCYSMHDDATPRVHVPLVTTPDCYFIFKQGVIEHMPAGAVYWVDTRKTHTFINCSSKSRLHLVGAVDE